MKEVVFNNDGLEEKDIDEVVTRTKALIINSKNEITLGYSYGVYQFPGGHLIEGESLLECLKREVKEETGISIKIDNLKPFLKIIHYTKNYRDSNKNRKNDIYYYVIKTDEKYDMFNAKLDKEELLGNYTVKIIPLDNIENTLINNKTDNKINDLIVKEMLIAIKEYKSII